MFSLVINRVQQGIIYRLGPFEGTFGIKPINPNQGFLIMDSLKCEITSLNYIQPLGRKENYNKVPEGLVCKKTLLPASSSILATTRRSSRLPPAAVPSRGRRRRPSHVKPQKPTTQSHRRAACITLKEHRHLPRQELAGTIRRRREQPRRPESTSQ